MKPTKYRILTDPPFLCNDECGTVEAPPPLADGATRTEKEAKDDDKLIYEKKDEEK